MNASKAETTRECRGSGSPPGLPMNSRTSGSRDSDVRPVKATKIKADDTVFEAMQPQPPPHYCPGIALPPKNYMKPNYYGDYSDEDKKEDTTPTKEEDTTPTEDDQPENGFLALGREDDQKPRKVRFEQLHSKGNADDDSDDDRDDDLNDDPNDDLEDDTIQEGTKSWNKYLEDYLNELDAAPKNANCSPTAYGGSLEDFEEIDWNKITFDVFLDQFKAHLCAAKEELDALYTLPTRGAKSNRAFLGHVITFLKWIHKHKGECPNIPQNNPDNRKFGIWVNKMRSFKTKLDNGDKTLREVEKMKVEILKTFGFTWGGRKGEVAWEKNFSELLAFIDKHGHAKIPTKTSGGLGRWVCVQRAEKRKKDRNEPSQLTDDKIERLENAGFIWCLR